MRYFLISIVMFLSFANAAMLDVDYNFIDTAFDGIKPITDKQFDDTINALTPQPVDNTFGGKLKAFLFGRKYGSAPVVKQDVEFDFGGEKKAIEDIKDGIYYIKLVVSIVGANEQVIPLGNYKIQEKIINDTPMLVFYQGNKEYGMLKLKHYEDTQKKDHDLTYSRVDIVSDEFIRVVYSTISDTKCALARVYLQN